MNFYDKEALVSKPCNNIKITFKSYYLPVEVVIFKAKIKVTQFISRPLFVRNAGNMATPLSTVKINKNVIIAVLENTTKTVLILPSVKLYCKESTVDPKCEERLASTK